MRRKAQPRVGGLAALCILAALFLPGTARSQAALCDAAAAGAARAYDVPLDVLRAITRVETGRRLDGAFSPWPWTTNRAGDSRWYSGPAEARRETRRALQAGYRNIDIGCFQINHRWHATAFTSLDEMFSPDANARYAAQFLRRLHGEFGSWDLAVAAYHSRTPHHADRYMRRFRDVHASLPPWRDQQQVATAARRNSGPRPLDLSRRAPLTSAPFLPVASRRTGPLIGVGALPLFDGAP